jgi:hypothetical protein
MQTDALHPDLQPKKLSSSIQKYSEGLAPPLVANKRLNTTTIYVQNTSILDTNDG